MKISSLRARRATARTAGNRKKAMKLSMRIKNVRGKTKSTNKRTMKIKSLRERRAAARASNNRKKAMKLSKKIRKTRKNRKNRKKNK